MRVARLRLARLMTRAASAAVAGALLSWAPSAFACNVDGDCPATEPICDHGLGGGAGTCRTCNSLLDCTAFLSLPVCALSGPLKGECVVCATLLDCSGTTPFCDVAIGVCLGCSTDSECGSATSGRVCDVGTGACENGCRGTGGNTCPAGDKCSSTGTTIGTCTLPDGGPVPDDAGASDGGSDGGRTDGGDGGGTGNADGGSEDGGKSAGDGGGSDGGGSEDGGNEGDATVGDGGGNDSGDGGSGAKDGGGAGEDGSVSSPDASEGDGSAGGSDDGGSNGNGDGGDLAGGYVDGGGCSCRMAPESSGGAAALFGLVGVVMLGARARRRGGGRTR